MIGYDWFFVTDYVVILMDFKTILAHFHIQYLEYDYLDG